MVCLQAGHSINCPAMSGGASSDCLQEGQLNLMSLIGHSSIDLLAERQGSATLVTRSVTNVR
jgi:hypothetical protein